MADSVRKKREYTEKQKEANRLRAREYYLKNKEKSAAQSRGWKKANPEIVKKGNQELVIACVNIQAPPREARKKRERHG
jgi:hypothetical protein